MSRPCNSYLCGLVALGLSLIMARAACAQTPWATLAAPPLGSAPPGDVLRAGHLGREIGETQAIIHFYSDLIGLGLVGARDASRPFMVSHPLAEFAELGEDDDAYKSVSRVALLPIPGTATATDGAAMTIEAIEIKGIRSHQYNPPVNAPGASVLKLIVSDLDKTLALLKSERTPVISDKSEPVELSAWPGLTGRIRAVMVQDPDGYPVQLMQLTPAPSSTAAASAKVLGARVAIVVDDIEATARLYQSLIGPDFKLWASPGWLSDRTYQQLTGVAAPFRIAMGLVPGSPVILELIEYKGHDRRYVRGHIQDPGTAHFLFMVKDTDVIMERVRAAHLHTLSRSNAPVFIGPTTRSFFVPDPQGVWLEFMDHDVKRDPAAKQP
jgi:catechol 2,3-dioxygenase-like lactoylglutathione lyase family enzyme